MDNNISTVLLSYIDEQVKIVKTDLEERFREIMWKIGIPSRATGDKVTIEIENRLLPEEINVLQKVYQHRLKCSQLISSNGKWQVEIVFIEKLR